MFGYITVDKPEMKVKDFYRYKAYYCGLCKSLQENYGLKGRVTLSYDVTFLVLVLTSLYEPKEEKSESRNVRLAFSILWFLTLTDIWTASYIILSDIL